MPKTASVLLTVRAPAGLHLVEALQQEMAGGRSAPEYQLVLLSISSPLNMYTE